MAVRVAILSGLLACLGACSSTTTTPAGTAAGDIQADLAILTDVPGADADLPDAAQPPVDIVDATATPEDVVDAASQPDIDWGELLDPTTDATATTDIGKPPVGTPVGQLYAHTKDTLYRLDLQAGQFTLVAKFTFDKSAGSVTDIALDASGKLYSITDHDLFACEAASAICKWVTKFPGTGTFNGLSFVPKGTVDVGETLIGIATDGSWNKIDFTGAAAKVTKLGDYGGTWLSSGDAFSVEGIGTYATLKTAKSTSDTLALVDPKDGTLLKIIGDTGVKQLFGLAWWQGVFYGFSADGNVYTLDVISGKATVVSGITVPKGAQWWGAGVSTRANGPVN